MVTASRGNQRGSNELNLRSGRQTKSIMRIFSRILGAALIAAGSTCAFGQFGARIPSGHPVPLGSEKVMTLRATSAAAVDAKGHIGPWIQLKNETKDAPSWQMVWDSMSSNPSTLAAFSGNPYGTSFGPYRLDKQDYKRYMWLEDMTVNPATAGKVAQFIRVALHFNPAGTVPNSGSSSLYLRISTVDYFDNTTYGPAYSGVLGSVVITFSNQATGNVYAEANLSSTGLGLPAPYAGGGFLVEVGTVGAGNTFQALQLPFSVQPILSNMLSPGEPQRPGSNPSSSSEFQWYDDSNVFFIATNWPDYIFQDFTNTNETGNTYAEYYTWDTSLLGFNYGNLQASASFFTDQNARKISGTLILSDLPASAVRKPRFATFTIIDRTNNSVVTTVKAPISGSGQYEILDPRPTTGGSYRVLAKASTWLTAGVNVTTTSGNATNANVTLLNGDCDNSNYIGTDDYLILNAAFDTSPSDTGWDARADLDGNELVGTDDYLILNKNFDLAGETP